jgi:hypothetical protein
MVWRAEQLRDRQLIRGAGFQCAQLFCRIVDFGGIDDSVTIHVQGPDDGRRGRTKISIGSAALVLAAAGAALSPWPARALGKCGAGRCAQCEAEDGSAFGDMSFHNGWMGGISPFVADKPRTPMLSNYPREPEKLLRKCKTLGAFHFLFDRVFP